ncbi:HD domain-containing phosphohydrolase [Pseudomonas petrae]|uniref:Response regulator n=1 Tax=Pseudomonas petrae TaxID=2912190 RepID=A0ABS9I5Z8_9PSED|nr:HD domain-containing phosphohydrolase [Pseudomonas petrae]MCF7532970.1 response regulator [Pseudomonas petrae]MCF7543200.1 response regulator [Pseudomonas petrae]MCF7554736.1 response regulator [Pseudomonas petrae]
MEESASGSLQQRPTVLLVDDEEPILNSLRRLLRGQPYDVLLATSGEQALAIMAERNIDLIMSDARMPNMDGATLLARVYSLYPDTTRILLTGFADLETIVKAINEGQIHRYIAKPWTDEELVLTLRQSLAFQFSERERQRLEQLTQRQNDELKSLNATLEKRVLARTAELQQTADMLDLAYEELKHSYATGTEVFSLLVNQRLPPDKQTNRRVIDLINVCGDQFGLDEATRRDLSMAAALYNIGKLGWSDVLINTPADMVTHADKETYRSYPRQSESLLMTLEPMQDATKLILHHQERWDGSGFPAHLKGEAIPFGARLLKLAVDFIELQGGLILERHMSSDEALLFIRKYSGKLYDPSLTDGFAAACAAYLNDAVLNDPRVKAVTTRDLVPGMTLVRNLNAENGMLLLNAGKVINAALIDKLVAFEAMENKGKYHIFVRLPDEATALDTAKSH